jgi:hypothetical protein
MTRAEQNEIIQALRDYENKMKGRDRDDFDMFKKRHKDDEELDAMSRKRLIELYETYVPARYR